MTSRFYLKSRFGQVQITSLRHRMPENIQRELQPQSDETATALIGQLWTRHPDGFRVYVPRGAEHYFELIKNAILRYPPQFAYVQSSTRETCGLLSLAELEALEDWLLKAGLRVAGQRSDDPLLPNVMLEWLKDMRKRVNGVLEERREYVREHGTDSFIGMQGGVCL